MELWQQTASVYNTSVHSYVDDHRYSNNIHCKTVEIMKPQQAYQE